MKTNKSDNQLWSEFFIGIAVQVLIGLLIVLAV